MATVFVHRIGRRSLVFVVAVLLAVVAHAGFLLRLHLPRMLPAQFAVAGHLLEQPDPDRKSCADSG